MWAYSVDKIFPTLEENNEDLETRIFTRRNYPTIAVWCIIGVYLFGRDILAPLLSELALVLPKLHCFLGRETIPWEGNPRYFDAISRDQKHSRLDENILKPGILEGYRNQLSKAEKSWEIDDIVSNGIPLGTLETYDINGNPAVTESFGLNSKYLSTQRRRASIQNLDKESAHEPYVGSYMDSTAFNKIRGSTMVGLHSQYAESELDYIRKIMLLVLEKDPLKLKHLPAFLLQFQGHEDLFYKLLVSKFGVGNPKYRDATYDERLRNYLAEKAPDMLSDADKLLSHYKGSEVDLFVLLVAQYGPLWKERLVDMYTEKDPSKLSTIDAELEQYKGHEALLIKNIEAQYGPLRVYEYQEKIDIKQLPISEASLNFFEEEFGNQSDAKGNAFELPQTDGNEDWIEMTDMYGNAYYHNNVNGETRWDNPKALSLSSNEPQSYVSANNAPSLPDNWEKAYTEDGYIYYHNVATNETSWEFPATSHSVGINQHPASTTPMLPENWEKASTDDGYIYYHNVVTNETSWEFPGESSANAESQAPLPPNWEVAYTEDGQTFYHNTSTGETSWNYPQ